MGEAVQPAGLLARIVARKVEEVESLPERGGESFPGRPFRFREALERNPGAPLRIIAECKKASPSRGLLRPDYDPGQLAETYARLGAGALSVLTDRDFFQGDPSHIPAALKSGLPVLRKDFIISEKQIFEARRLGAHAILLIVRILTDRQLRELQRYAAELGLDILVETHNEEEIHRALEADSRIIGINHRDLDTLTMDLSLTERMAPLIRSAGPDRLIVAESGIESREGLKRIDAVADAALIGSVFMGSSDLEATWKDLFSPV